jgi:hypothetical protein
MESKKFHMSAWKVKKFHVSMESKKFHTSAWKVKKFHTSAWK